MMNFDISSPKLRPFSGGRQSCLNDGNGGAKQPYPSITKNDWFGAQSWPTPHRYQLGRLFGIPFERLNKLVLDAGLLPSETSGRGRNLIEAHTVDRIVTEMAATFSQKEVATKLGVTRKLGRQLINGGLLKPSFKVKQRPGARIIPRYPAEQVTTLLANLRAVANCTDMSELHDLHTSIKHCGCTFIKAINLIRTEKLSKIGWDESEIGLAALRVDQIEMRLLMMRQNSIISDRQSKRSMAGPQPHGSPNRQSLL